MDGTKIAENAALAANRTHEGLEKELAKEAAKMLAAPASPGRRTDIRMDRSLPATEQGLRAEHEVVRGHDLHRHDRDHGEEVGEMRLLIHAPR